MKYLDTINLPSFAACPLVNDDYSGLSEEDIKEVNDFLNTFEKPVIFDIKGEEYFSSCPAFGLAGDCLECDIYEA